MYTWGMQRPGYSSLFYIILILCMVLIICVGAWVSLTSPHPANLTVLHKVIYLHSWGGIQFCFWPPGLSFIYLFYLHLLWWKMRATIKCILCITTVNTSVTYFYLSMYTIVILVIIIHVFSELTNNYVTGVEDAPANTWQRMIKNLERMFWTQQCLSREYSS